MRSDQKGETLIRQLPIILVFIISCSASLSWEAVERDHVESLDVFRNGNDMLEIHIECGRGIGSVSLDFGEPVQGDSIRIVLMYDSLHHYDFCESLSLEYAGGGDSNLSMINHSMIDLGEDGSVVMPVDEGFTMLKIGWIDFYRQ